MDKNTFTDLLKVDVSGYVEKKKSDNGMELSYLSWANAVAEMKKRFPNLSYEIVKFNGLPYVYDPMTGYMVYTNVTIDGVTHEMWLPVMDGKNRAMKAEPYEYTTKYGKKTVEAATMMDINRAIMRCLTKNFAMFGLGLALYAGDDIWTENDEKPKKEKKSEAQAAKDAYPDRETMCRVIEKVHGKNARFSEYLKSKGAATVWDLSDAAIMATYGSISEPEIKRAIEEGQDD